MSAIFAVFFLMAKNVRYELDFKRFILLIKVYLHNITFPLSYIVKTKQKHPQLAPAKSEINKIIIASYRYYLTCQPGRIGVVFYSINVCLINVRTFRITYFGKLYGRLKL